jgi:hypothetical protein
LLTAEDECSSLAAPSDGVVTGRCRVKLLTLPGSAIINWQFSFRSQRAFGNGLGVYDSRGNGRPARARRAEALERFETAGATRVQVQVVMSDSVIHGVVADDGKGFVVAQRNNLPGNLGLLALKERALMAGGWYEIESQPGLGTRIECWLPLPS